jgi:hypothetical protein
LSSLSLAMPSIQPADKIECSRNAGSCKAARVTKWFPCANNNLHSVPNGRLLSGIR